MQCITEGTKPATATRGYFKIRLKGFARWFVCGALPAERIYQEWLYIDHRGVPTMYWNQTKNGVMLLG